MQEDKHIDLVNGMFGILLFFLCLCIYYSGIQTIEIINLVINLDYVFLFLAYFMTMLVLSLFSKFLFAQILINILELPILLLIYLWSIILPYFKGVLFPLILFLIMNFILFLILLFSSFAFFEQAKIPVAAICYISFTSCSILYSLKGNWILKNSFMSTLFLRNQVEEYLSKPEKEIHNNNSLFYKIFIKSNIMAFKIASKLFNQYTFKFIVYSLYLLLIVLTSVIELSNFDLIKDISILNRITFLSFITFVAFDRVISNKHLIKNEILDS